MVTIMVCAGVLLAGCGDFIGGKAGDPAILVTLEPGVRADETDLMETLKPRSGILEMGARGSDQAEFMMRLNAEMPARDVVRLLRDLSEMPHVACVDVGLLEEFQTFPDPEPGQHLCLSSLPGT